MRFPPVSWTLVVVGSLLVFQPALAQTATSSSLRSPAASSPKTPFEDLKDTKKQADVANEVFDKLTASNSALAWLKALNIHFKTFEPSSSDKNAALGFDYQFDKAVTGAKLISGDNPAILSLSIKARGNVSFDKDNNPADFLQSGIQFHLWQYFGVAEEDPIGSDGLPLSSRTSRELTRDEYRNLSIDELLASAKWQDYVRHAFDRDPSEFIYDVAGNASLESNQTFSKKQWAYGLEVHASMTVWDPDSPATKFNFVDWPFALTRMIGGEEFRSRFLPAIMAGIDLVDPVGNNDRFNVDPDKSAYPRFKTEIGFRSRVIEIGRKPIWFNASYRYFQEIGASSAIRTANMDTQHYFAASLELLWNITITYSVGKLPFDLKDQQVWELGYKINY